MKFDGKLLPDEGKFLLLPDLDAQWEIGCRLDSRKKLFKKSIYLFVIHKIKVH